MERLIHCEWKGNIRELENNIEKMVVLSDENLIDVDFLTEVGQKLLFKEPTSLKLRDVLEKTERKPDRKCIQGTSKYSQGSTDTGCMSVVNCEEAQEIL